MKGGFNYRLCMGVRVDEYPSKCKLDTTCNVQIFKVDGRIAAYMKEWDIALGKHDAQRAYSVYVPHFEQLNHVLWLEVGCFVEIAIFTKIVVCRRHYSHVCLMTL